MPRSRLLARTTRRVIEARILGLLNDNADEFRGLALNSPRAVGDVAQALVAANFLRLASDRGIRNYDQAFARRAMADLAFEDSAGSYYVMDVKTHRLDSSFDMPNLISVERLARFYEEPTNYFVLLKIGYAVESARIRFADVAFVPIEFVSWECLTLGALGWGQIQIANANRVILDDRCTRKRWMLNLCDRLDLFYPAEMTKIRARLDYFAKVRVFWERQPD